MSSDYKSGMEKMQMLLGGGVSVKCVVT